MIWNVFRRRRGTSSPEAQWWHEANREASAPTPAGVARLRDGLAAQTTSDDVETQEEMVDGLDAVIAAAAAPLPVVETQHRVIGADACHLAVPVTLAADVGVPGKLFLTASKCIFAGGKVQSWAWHRVRQVDRTGRDISLVIHGADALVLFQTNCYTDALLIAHFASRLRRNGQ